MHIENHFSQVAKSIFVASTWFAPLQFQNALATGHSNMKLTNGELYDQRTRHCFRSNLLQSSNEHPKQGQLWSSQNRKEMLALEKGDVTSTYKLHLVLTVEAYELFQEVRHFLEAESDVETFRRIVRALDFVEPTGVPSKLGPNHLKSGSGKKHLYFEPDTKTKERLDYYKSEHGYSYQLTVLYGLCVVAQLMRNINNAEYPDANGLVASIT